jgi:antitoxin VapB
MSFSIKDSETDALVRQLAALTGESITQAVFQSVKERLERLKPKNSVYSLAQDSKPLPSVVLFFPYKIPAHQKS